jgi:Tfp pilus assembly protein PilX
MKTKTVRSARITSRKRQQGMVSILIAIIVLVVTLLAAVALLRSVDTSNSIAGSLAFRQAVLQEASRAYGDARAKITYSEPTSDADHKAVGYYATPQSATIRPDKDIPDILVNETSGSVVAMTPLAPTDNHVFYVVERLCPTVGAAVASTCVAPGASIQGGSVSNQTKDNGPPFSSGVSAAFRLSVRVDGPKGAVAYVQTIMR